MTPIYAFDVATDGTASTAEINQPATGAYRWLHCDLNDPDLPAWAERNLPLHVASALTAKETRPRVTLSDHSLLANFRAINLNDGDDVEDMVALRLWVTPDLIVSVRRRRVFALDDLRQRFENNDAPTSAAAFLAALTEHLIDRIEAVSLAVDAQTDTFEDDVHDDGVSHVPALGPTRRKVIKLRRYIGPQADALRDLAKISPAWVDSESRYALHETANRARRTEEELTEVRDRLSALGEHLDLAQSARTNRNSYLLSAVAAIFLPLGFLTGLFGVNVAGMPGMTAPWAFAALTVATLVIGLLTFLVLWWRNLL
ncbi:MAG: zinc transporter ZntB [Octadecabacter sp.]|nr:zinc transporter ZntB [Octadecabacter sp.]